MLRPFRQGCLRFTTQGRAPHQTSTSIVATAIAFLCALGGTRRASADQATKEVVVFEAASLKGAFGRLAERFTKEHPDVKVVFNAAGSQELRAQIESGAEADVYASADRKQMEALVAEGLVAAPAVFTCNEPVVVIRPAVAATLKTFADLPLAERIVVGAPEVPIGAYTLQILQKAAARYGADFFKRVDARIASRELNVRQVLAKVMLGEADAGIVYRSDAAAASGKVRVLSVPPELNVTADYPIAVLKHAPNAALARAWVDLVRSTAGSDDLRAAGFSPCPKR